jgi:predicted homoserine dehydrogenase-like protein
MLDGVGGFTWYGLVETAGTLRQEGLLPMGLAEGATVVRPIAVDTPLTYDDVEIAEGTAVARLRRQQDQQFASSE